MLWEHPFSSLIGTLLTPVLPNNIPAIQTDAMVSSFPHLSLFSYIFWHLREAKATEVSVFSCP